MKYAYDKSTSNAEEEEEEGRSVNTRIWDLWLIKVVGYKTFWISFSLHANLLVCGVIFVLILFFY